MSKNTLSSQIFFRPSGRKAEEIRNIEIVKDVSIHAEGSCYINFGNTRILCIASLDSEKVPNFIRNTGSGWITAEYGMLPRSTGSRMKREAKNGQSGRTQEIQRLIGRSLRSVVDLKKLGERQIIVDCDVIQADGGTRTAAITGGYVALYLACEKLVKDKVIKKNPIVKQVAAISCGILNGNVVADLDYAEDSNAEADSNFVMTDTGEIIEIQATAETYPFTQDKFSQMLKLAEKSIKQLCKIQNKILELE